MNPWRDRASRYLQLGEPRIADADLEQRFVEDRRETVQRQAPFAAVVFLTCILGFSLVEMWIRPNHRDVLAMLSPFPFAISALGLLALRRWPRHAVGITVATINGLIASVFSYTALVRGSGELVVIAATLTLGGVVALLPFGPRNQLAASLSALVGYPLVMQLGAMTWTTPWYSASALVTAVVVMAIGAATVDGYRRRILQGALNHERLADENEGLMRQAQAAHRSKADFLATASHELRTPLGAIVGYTDMLIDGTLSEEDERADALERVRAQALAMLEMLQNLLDADKIEAGQQRVDWSDVSLRDVLEQLQRSVPPTWCKPNVSLVWDLPDTEFIVRSDAAKLMTILRNLLHNATKYTHAGEVRLSVGEDAEGRVVVRVADTGEGIPADDLPFVFERFRQSANPSRSGGLGLGLFIVKQFADAIGATIEVDSERGRGTQFSIQLPRPTQPSRPA